MISHHQTDAGMGSRSPTSTLPYPSRNGNGSSGNGDDNRVPPKESYAQRQISMRSRGSFRGTIVNPLNGRELHYESALERDMAYILMTDPRVVDVREQVGPFPYMDDGRRRHHIFDFSAHLADGSTHLIAVKYERDVEKSGIVDVVNCIREGAAKRSGQKVHLRTDRQITRTKAENARLVFAANRYAEVRVVEHLKEVVATLDGSMVAGSLLTLAGIDRAQGFWALAHLYGQRLLECPDGGVLSHSSRVRAVRVVGGVQ